VFFYTIAYAILSIFGYVVEGAEWGYQFIKF